jgi:serine/threonine-protein kinase RsbW
MDVALTLRVPLEEVSVPVVRRLCRAMLHTIGVDEDCAHDIELAVTEACTNVLKHGTMNGDEYEVEIKIDGAICDISVRDSGRGFDHHTAVRHIPIPAAESGRGLHLMSAVTDELSFASEPDSGTVVQLSKELAMGDESVLGFILTGKRASE